MEIHPLAKDKDWSYKKIYQLQIFTRKKRN